MFALFHWTAPALAETVHVTASADAGLSQAQARQQALDRALSQAVYQGALRLLPGPMPEPRLAALRKHLSPKSLDFVNTYHETSASRQPTAASADQAAQAHAAPLELELDVDVQRPLLRQTLVRLGFLAAARHPGTYALRLGPGVKDKDCLSFEPESLLLGLARAPQPAAAPVEVTLERLPQGYYKAVLRQGAVVLAADATDLPALWLGTWAAYFTDSRVQPGPGLQRLGIAGFASVDAVQDFVRLLASWDEAVQQSGLAGMDINAEGISAQFGCRVISQEALDARLAEALPARKLRLAAPAGTDAP